MIRAQLGRVEELLTALAVRLGADAGDGAAAGPGAGPGAGPAAPAPDAPRAPDTAALARKRRSKVSAGAGASPDDQDFGTCFLYYSVKPGLRIRVR